MLNTQVPIQPDDFCLIQSACPLYVNTLISTYEIKILADLAPIISMALPPQCSSSSSSREDEVDEVFETWKLEKFQRMLTMLAVAAVPTGTAVNNPAYFAQFDDVSAW